MMKNLGISRGGSGHKHSAETRAKIAASNRGGKRSLETRAKMSAAHTGRKHSIEARKNLSAAIMGENHPGWKGGRCINGQGYVLVYRPGHPFATKAGYVREHRLVMENRLGRFLLPQEVPHHINGDRADNRDENLELFSSKEKHTQFHKLKGLK